MCCWTTSRGVEKLDQVFPLNLKMSEVETGRLMKAVSGRYESMGKMVGDEKNLVERLIGSIGQAQAAEPPAEAKSASTPALPGLGQIANGNALRGLRARSSPSSACCPAIAW